MASKANIALDLAKQAEKLSLHKQDSKHNNVRDGTAVEARFITPQDPIIVTADGSRLPPVPLQEALKLNQLKDAVEAKGDSWNESVHEPGKTGHEEELDEHDGTVLPVRDSQQSSRPEAAFRNAIPPYRTHPLFPPLPLYGPPSLMREIQALIFRVSSAILSTCFLGTIVLGSAFTSISLMLRHIGLRLTFRDPDARRPFYEEEKKRQRARNAESRAWKRQKRRKSRSSRSTAGAEEDRGQIEEFEPTEGGNDPLICDVGYYARRVGLDVEEFRVQTEDGFLIELWHLYNPKQYSPSSAAHREHRDPIVFPSDRDVEYDAKTSDPNSGTGDRNARYPVLLVHGLLQSAGAYCANDDESLAFYLCKSGYDVWLGNNRCGFQPRHCLLKPTDPRMWSWNIRQMGVLDLPALISRVLSETGFEKLGLICHSQGTTETFVALAKEQRPDLGNKISVFCALAPAVYAGPLIGKMYFKFMRIISPGMFRMIFGIHSFIPLMMSMHKWLPGRLYGSLGYRVFSFLFNWTDDRWDQGIRDRLFQFAPVYVSAESMRWWLGRECFATQKCILATREEGKIEDEEDEEEDYYVHNMEHSTEHMLKSSGGVPNVRGDDGGERGRRAWYDEQVPPFALWVAGSDELVDGRRLLRRFERNREPHVRVVHSKIIEEYEHLDVLWAMDSVDKVAKEVKEVLWQTVSKADRAKCRVPRDCETIPVWEG